MRWMCLCCPPRNRKFMPLSRFSGPKFTWSNQRQITKLILDRLDRCFANPSWRVQFPKAVVTHLPMVFSDHYPVLLELFKPPPTGLEKPFKFHTMRLHHPQFPEIVKRAWNFETNLPLAIKNFTAFAKQWTKMNLAISLPVRKGCWPELMIRGIQNSVGEWITNEDEIKISILSDYQQLFEIGLPYSNWASEVKGFSCTFLLDEDRTNLAALVYEDEIKQGLWALKPFKAPGADGSMRGSSNSFRPM
ncbi:hypothetical protein SO802_002138 [Lithocarpus litseifolius]|uniref:Reverse transcriptase n=1 Tax=Lithocarpus litseifolius TaxID=425828 RepID=A0AAW2E050_9ROSI